MKEYKRVKKHGIKRFAVAIASVAFSATLGMEAFVPAYASPGDSVALSTETNESGSTSSTYTAYTVNPTMYYANGASIANREIPVANSSAASGLFEKTSQSGYMTFGIINLTNYNEALANKGITRTYYLRYSLNTTDNTTVLVELVDKSTNAVVSDIEAIPGVTVTFNQLVTHASSLDQESYPEVVYSQVVGADGSSSGIININWTNGKANYYNSTLILSPNGGEANNDTEDARSDQPIRVPRISTMTTEYRVVDTNNVTTLTPSAYSANGNEAILASYSIEGYDGQSYTSSNLRDFSNYILYDGAATSGLVSSDYVAGTRFRAAGNPSNQYNVKSITTVVNTDTQATRDDLYVLDPSQSGFLDVADSLGETEIIGYLSVDPAGDAELRSDLLAMTTDELLASEYFVAASAATAAQKLNPAIYKGYKYVTSSDILYPYDSDSEGADIQNSKLTTAPTDTTLGSGYEGYFTLTDAHGKTATFVVVSGERSVTNVAGTTSTGTNSRVWVMAVPDGYIDSDGRPTDDFKTANIKVDPNTGLITNTFAEYNSGNFSDSDSEITIGGTGSTTLYNTLSVTEPTTYYYIEKGGVIVRYVDEDGNAIKSENVLAEHELDTTTYDSTTVRDNTISHNGKTYYYKEIEDRNEVVDGSTIVSGETITRTKYTTNESGNIENGTKTVITYVYALKGDVVVNYEDEDGNVLQDPVEDTSDAFVGTEYDTTDNRPEIITTYKDDGSVDKTYVRVPEKTEGKETGTVVEGTTEVTYVYREAHGNVVVYYKDEDGNEIQAPVEDTPESPLDTPYDTTDKRDEVIGTEDGKKYEIVPEKTEGEETGTVVEGTTEVTYIYREVKGNVYVHYEDEDGNVIKESVTDTEDASLGTDYDTTDNKPTAIIFNGEAYYYKEIKSGSDDEEGKVGEDDRNVTYVYRKTASWVPHIPGDDDPEDDKIKYPDAEDPDGEDPDDPTIPITPDTPIPYVPGYEPDLPLEPVDPDDPTKGYLPPEPEDPFEDTHIYYHAVGSVIVHYEDENGNRIADSVTDTDRAPVDSDYDTTDNKPPYIEYDGKTYELVRIKADSAPETGNVVEGTMEVTYVYREVVESDEDEDEDNSTDPSNSTSSSTVNPSGSSSSKAVSTGDVSTPIGWAVVTGLVSVFTLGFVTLRRKKSDD